MKYIILNRFLLTLFFFGILMSCEDITDWELEAGDNGKLVVEAIITNEEAVQTIELSISSDQLNGPNLPAENATVTFISPDQNISFVATPNNPGQYQSEFPFAAASGIEYILNIDWQNEIYTAQANMGTVTAIPPITFTQVDSTDTFRIDQVAPIYHPIEEAMYEVTIDWNHMTPSDSSQAKLLFYTFNTVDVSELFPPPKAEVLFPKGSIVIEKKFGLNPAFGDYLRALVMETEWKGGVFDEASSSLPTNISNGGLGFFGVCGLRRDTVVVE